MFEGMAAKYAPTLQAQRQKMREAGYDEYEDYSRKDAQDEAHALIVEARADIKAIKAIRALRQSVRALEQAIQNDNDIFIEENVRAITSSPGFRKFLGASDVMLDRRYNEASAFLDNLMN